MKPILSLLIFFVLGSIVIASDKSRDAQLDDIHEALFRHQFEHNGSGQQQKTGVFFLRLGKKDPDPSDDFMKRFAGNKPPVKKVSACSSSAKKGVVDKKTGVQGLIFYIESVKWISDTEIEAFGGYYEAGLSASGNTYTLKKEKGKWIVTKDKMNWIS